MDISSSIPNGGRSSPNIGNGGLNRHGMGIGRMDSDPSLYVPEGNSALSRRRICIALSLSVVLLILIGPSGLRGEAELSRTAGDGGRKRVSDNPFRTTGRKNKHGKNKKKKKHKNGYGNALYDAQGGDYAHFNSPYSLVDDDQLRNERGSDGAFRYAPVQDHHGSTVSSTYGKVSYKQPHTGSSSASVRPYHAALDPQGEGAGLYAPDELEPQRRDKVAYRSPAQQQQPLPVYDYSADAADQIPEGIGENMASRPAYDALECRSSVIDFVINATDVKDECEGLRKAFDKTCSAPSQQAVPDSSDAASAAEGYYRNRRRLLGTAELSYQDESWGGYTSRKLSNLWKGARYYSRRLRRYYLSAEGEEELAYVEDQVVGEAWDDAKYQIDHGYDESEEYVNNVRRILSYYPPVDKKKKSTMVLQGRRSLAASSDKSFVDGSGADNNYNNDEEDNWIEWADEAGVNIPNRTEVASVRRRRLEYHRSRFLKKQKRKNADVDAAIEAELMAEDEEAAAGGGELFGDDDQAAVDISGDQEVDNVEGRQSGVQPKDPSPNLGLFTSPKLPTSSEHVTGQMLNDAVRLTNGGTNQAIAAVLNATNGTASGVSAAVAAATADAHQSAEAVSKATAAVSAVMNDPSSVEARTCCASILNVFHEHCDHPDAEELTDSRLFIVVFVIAFCGMVKSLIRHFQLRWLPEAGGCILVGVLGAIIIQFFPHYDFGFDGEMFLRVMVPPIVFEAALSIDKAAFQRHMIPIAIYSVMGTLLSTFLTALVVSKGSHFLSLLGIGCPSIPFVESLTFGALISSIDPIAVLSVLNNMGMSDTDTIYVLIFGESLLNDGVAIVLFQTLVHFLDESLIIDAAATWAATCHFVVVAVGSVMIGLVSGACCTCYFYLMRGIQTPLVEVVMFLCWAFIPYYICDGVEWSGIVSIVAAGFVMDLYVVGYRSKSLGSADSIDSISTGFSSSNGSSLHTGYNGTACKGSNSTYGRIFSREGHLSDKSKNHIHFVTEINATLMETAIFAYLGLFLFNSRYHWNFWLSFIAIAACVASRAVMIPSLSLLANWLNGISGYATLRSLSKVKDSSGGSSGTASNDNRRGVFIDGRMQIVLWFAGLRGAMSFALVENIPLFDTVTGQGSRFKPELKAMTSACIVFTVFVLGGSTFYLMERLGMSLSKDDDMLDLGKPLVGGKKGGKGPGCARKKLPDVSLAELGIDASDISEEPKMRQRGKSRMSPR